MKNTVVQGRIETLIRELSLHPELKDNSNIISLTSNELADILLGLSREIRKETSVDELLQHAVNVLGKYGIAERVLLFQIDSDKANALLTHYWESSYVTRFNPIGFQLSLRDAPLFKLFNLNENRTLQIEDFTKYLALPHYLFRNKFKALFIKLKTKSLLVTTGSTNKIKVAVSLQFCTKDVIWSNEIEKALQSIADQLAVAIEQSLGKKKRESLQKNIVQLQESAIKEQEQLLRQFASDIHDLPCSIIPNLRQAIQKKDLIECERLVDELNHTLRQLINEYVIPDISLLGFGSTIYQFVNGFKKTFKGKILVELPDEEINISQKKAAELYKVIREWFCNIEKHSSATEVYLKVEKLNESYFLIIISDNGRGFDANDTKNFGYGILNIKRRLLEMNSKLEIQSKLGEGSTIKIQSCLN